MPRMERRDRMTPSERAVQERDLVVAAESGDPEACRELVEAFLPDISTLARAFPVGSGVSRHELLQEGVAGLLFAARRYDTRLDTPFWSYASYWVRKAMQELIAEVTRPVALSDRAVRSLAAVRAARREHLAVHGVDPTMGDLSRATGLSRSQIEALQAVERGSLSLDQPADRDHTFAETVGDGVPDPSAEHAYELVLDRIEIHRLRRLADQLTDRERAVVEAHYGIGTPPQTLGTIGATLGVSAERVRQIEVAALAKLRAGLTRSAPTAEGLP
jgi:RNA polymerase primary sigma factor